MAVPKRRWAPIGTFRGLSAGWAGGRPERRDQATGLPQQARGRVTDVGQALAGVVHHDCRPSHRVDDCTGHQFRPLGSCDGFQCTSGSAGIGGGSRITCPMSTAAVLSTID